MEFYWWLSDIPELRKLEKAQQAEVWGATAGVRLRDPFLLLAAVVCLVVVGVFFTLGCILLPTSYGGVIGGGVGGGLGAGLALGISMPRARPYLAVEIRRRSW